MAHRSDLPLIRHSERVTFKRCPKKWYWAWRMGLVPKAKAFGALDLGTWMHAAFADWYTGDRNRQLDRLLAREAEEAIYFAQEAGAPEHQLAKASELWMLGEAMMRGYQKHYGTDDDVNVIAAEIPLEFEIADRAGRVVAIHKLKPDHVYADRAGDIWLMEHKSANAIRTEHLPIDDQGRPYVAMAELALRKLGVISKGDHFRGMMYNFVRKALPDERAQDEQGRYLNKNGTVSKKQPSPVFVRHPLELTRAQKRIALTRLSVEAQIITGHTRSLRANKLDPFLIPKTPHWSCPRFCDYFTMCVAEDQGANIKEMQRSIFTRRNPYLYDEEHPTTDIPVSFEMG